MTSSEESTRDTMAPRHVAFVMDGNGRWATRQGLPRLDGHRAGIANVGPVVDALVKHGVEFMTIYMFSTENWKRPDEEVAGIFEILGAWLRDVAPGMKRRGIGIRHYGRRDRLPAALLEKLDDVCGPVEDQQLLLGLALDYGGRTEILTAVERLLADRVPPGNIDEAAIDERLYTNGVPAPDLLIRPGGEYRLSNFMLWQAAYTELYFSRVLWPDFDETELQRALDEYARRHRRFGGL